MEGGEGGWDAQELQPMAGRRLQASGARTLNGTSVVLGQWHNVSSPVTYLGFSTGTYALQVRALDAAGNLGDPSDPYVFAVDESLAAPSPPSTSSSDDGGGSDTTTIIIAVTCSVGGALILAAIIAIIVVRYKKRRRRSASYFDHNRDIPAVVDPAAVALAQSHQMASLEEQLRRQDEAERLRLAMEVSLVEQRRQHPTRMMDDDERLKAAIAASLEEENLRKAIERSKMDDVRDTEEKKLQEAIKRSLQPQFKPPGSGS